MGIDFLSFFFFGTNDDGRSCTFIVCWWPPPARFLQKIDYDVIPVERFIFYLFKGSAEISEERFLFLDVSSIRWIFTSFFSLFQKPPRVIRCDCGSRNYFNGGMYDIRHRGGFNEDMATDRWGFTIRYILLVLWTRLHDDFLCVFNFSHEVAT